MFVFPIADFLCNFWQRRVSVLGLEDKVVYCYEVPGEESFDKIICFNVVEHLPSLSQQLLDFYKMLSHEGKIILNWDVFKVFNQKFAFHQDPPQIMEIFF
jgi:hypothetical protein